MKQHFQNGKKSDCGGRERVKKRRMKHHAGISFSGVQLVPDKHWSNYVFSDPIYGYTPICTSDGVPNVAVEGEISIFTNSLSIFMAK